MENFSHPGLGLQIYRNFIRNSFNDEQKRETPTCDDSRDQGHDPCSCKAEMKVMKETINQLTAKVEKYEGMFLEFKTMQEIMAGKCTSNERQMEDKSSQTNDPQRDGDLHPNMESAATVTLKEEPAFFVEDEDSGHLIIDEDQQEDIQLQDAKSEMATSSQQPQSVLKTTKDKGASAKKRKPKRPPIYFSCPQCSRTFKTLRFLEAHLKRHLEQYTCKVCNRIYKDESAMLRHVQFKHNRGQFKCNQCGRRFMDVSGFNYHMMSHSAQEKLPINAPPPRRPSQPQEPCIPTNMVYFIYP